MPHTWSESNSCVTQRLRRCDFQNAKMYSGDSISDFIHGVEYTNQLHFLCEGHGKDFQ